MSRADVAVWVVLAVLAAQLVFVSFSRHRVSPRTNNLFLIFCGSMASAASFWGALDSRWMLVPAVGCLAATVWAVRQERLRAARQNG
jgi:hypothetical protein